MKNEKKSYIYYSHGNIYPIEYYTIKIHKNEFKKYKQNLLKNIKNNSHIKEDKNFIICSFLTEYEVELYKKNCRFVKIIEKHPINKINPYEILDLYISKIKNTKMYSKNILEYLILKKFDSGFDIAIVTNITKKEFELSNYKKCCSKLFPKKYFYIDEKSKSYITKIIKKDKDYEMVIIIPLTLNK